MVTVVEFGSQLRVLKLHLLNKRGQSADTMLVLLHLSLNLLDLLISRHWVARVTLGTLGRIAQGDSRELLLHGRHACTKVVVFLLEAIGKQAGCLFLL